MTTTPAATPPPRPLRQRWARTLIEIAVMFIIVGAITFWRGQSLVRDDSDWSSVVVHDLDGAPHALPDLLGERNMVHVWATWCGVCKANHGVMDIAYTWLDARPARAVLTLVTDDADTDAIRAHIEHYGIDAPVYVISSDDTYALGVRAFPTTLFMDEHARVYRALVGFVTPIGGALGMALVR
jgi:thiol-disulfide isomerase/thioredoxin